MKVTVPDQNDFDGAAPWVVPPGIHAGVLAEVVDLGWQDSQWGYKHKLKLVFETSPEAGEHEGRQLTIDSAPMTISFHKRSALKPILDKLGFKPQVGDEFDFDDMVGTNVQLVVVHNEVERGDETKTYANIDSVILNPSGELEVSDDFQAFAQREFKFPEPGPAEKPTDASSMSSMKNMPDPDAPIPF